jgi:hypothetical protein
MRRLVALLVLTAPAGCAALVDWGTLTDDHGARDASAGADAPATDGTVVDAREEDAGSGPDADAGAVGDADASAVDPCSTIAQQSCALCNGYYCGKSMQNGFAGGARNVVYLCIDGSTDKQGTITCQTQCLVSENQYADCCDQCTGFADGTYCGSTLGYLGGYNGAFTELQSVIFTCEGGLSVAGEIPCAPERCVQQGATKAACAAD